MKGTFTSRPSYQTKSVTIRLFYINLPTMRLILKLGWFSVATHQKLKWKKRFCEIMISLEEIRDKIPVGTIVLFSPQFPELLKNPLPLFYMNYSQNAFYFTKLVFKQFENEKVVA